MPRLKLWRDQRGANLVEYLLLVALIAVVSIAAVRMFGTVVHNKYDEARKKTNQL